jgi:guanylate kinase
MKQVVVISGPTGSGESTLTRELIRRYPGKISRLVTATTRPPRSGETDGVDYYFFSKERFEQEKQAGNMLEFAHIANRDTWYGTYAPDLNTRLERGDIVIANTQIVGTRYFKEHYDATTIFIMPSDVDRLIQRIRARSPELSDAEIDSRRENAKKEVSEEGPYYDFAVSNEDGQLDACADSIVEILEKEGYTLE